MPMRSFRIAQCTLSPVRLLRLVTQQQKVTEKFKTSVYIFYTARVTLCLSCLLARLQTWRAIIFTRVSLSVCLSVCLWPALLPFNVNRFWRNLVIRTLLWSNLAATIMVQIGRKGTARRLFENLKKLGFSKITEFECQNSGPSFFASVSPVYCKKFDSIRRKLTEEIDFEVCPYGDSGNGTAAAGRCSTGYSDWTGGAAPCSDRSSGALRTGGIWNWGRNRAVKTNRLVCVSLFL